MFLKTKRKGGDNSDGQQMQHVETQNEIGEETAEFVYMIINRSI